ncbi:hypothetical protein B0H15DRAFT_958523 [Mycena belliarum]|uniref:Uncharacterized protein n=1 Tax=Mycena belliarum TaxID=1033014 RepID=A0AAD6TN20_9AGAR|nr:hypothetical protein B0H15DRAFT_958523 [Mycena belliae]
MCDSCIKFPAEVFLPTTTFYCPHCWDKGDPRIPNLDAQGTRPGNMQPYQGLFLNGKPLPLLNYSAKSTLRSHWPITDTSNFLIISIRLEGMKEEGDPAVLAAHHISPYYKNPPLRFASFSYNLASPKAAISYDNRIENLAEELLTSNLSPDKVVVFISTHTTPSEGLIHIAPGGEAAETADLVLRRLIPSTLQEVIRKANTSMLFLLACGAINAAPTRDQVHKFVQESGFKYGVGFTVDKFIPAEANTFIQEMVATFCISAHSKRFSCLLVSHYDLGAHTDIIVYFAGDQIF